MNEARRLTVCHGKHAYPNFDAAANVANLSSGRKTSRISAYKCPVCGWYHVGEKLQRGNKTPGFKYRKQRDKRKERKCE